MKWEKVKLGKYVEILSGFAFKSKDFLNCGVPVIKIKNITQEGVTLEDVSYISKELADKNEKYHLNYNDILIALTGSHINQMSSVVGRIARVKYHEDSVLNQRVGKVFAKDSKLCDIDYVYYFLSQDYIKISLASKAGGAANQANISPNDVKSLTVRWPDIETQHRIANILSAYDDLIENNQKQIKLLEEAARRLYKEWFVDLRFPAHENTKIVDGVPEGWKKERLVDIAEIQYGYAFDGTLFNADKNGTPIIRIRNIPQAETMDYTTEHVSENYLVQNGEIIVGMDGEFHINAWAGNTAYLVQRVCCIRPKNTEIKGWLLQAIYEPIKFFERTVVGATVAHLGKKHLDSIYLLTSPEGFYKPFMILFDKRLLLENQNRKLREARDRLLPKLMSGEVEV